VGKGDSSVTATQVEGYFTPQCSFLKKIPNFKNIFKDFI
jgi:peroxiredoxin